MAQCRIALSCALLVCVGACPDDQLVRQFARIDITALPLAYQTALEAPVGIDVGLTSVFGFEDARFEVTNPSTAILNIASASIVDPVGGNFTVIEFPRQLFATDKSALVVRFVPEADKLEGHAIIRLQTNAGPNQNLAEDILVRGTGIFTGEPKLEVCYGGGCYPAAGQCQGEGAARICTLPPLSFGNVPVSRESKEELRLRNVPTADTCLPLPNQAACAVVCQVTFDKDISGHDVGVEFEPTTAGFGLDGSAQLPLVLDPPPPSPECAWHSEKRMVVRFQAGDVIADVTATFRLESNAPNAPLIVIPLTASVREAPIAVARLRACSGEDPPPDCTDPEDIRPLTDVYLDGRQSRDPNNLELVAYTWQAIEYPAGASPADFDLAPGQTTTLWPPLAGTYVVRLTVVNLAGVASGVSETSDVRFKAVPHSRLHLELVWDDPDSDQDLHLLNLEADDRICNKQNDCYWTNCRAACDPAEGCPHWVPADPVFTGANPRLDLDDTNGLGPENSVIDEPIPGRYGLFVHYYAQNITDALPTTSTVRVYIDGLMQTEVRRLLVRNDLWKVGTVVWTEEQGGTVEIAPSDGAGVGAVRHTYFCKPQEGGRRFDQ